MPRKDKSTNLLVKIGTLVVKLFSSISDMPCFALFSVVIFCLSTHSKTVQSHGQAYPFIHIGHPQTLEFKHKVFLGKGKYVRDSRFFEFQFTNDNVKKMSYVDSNGFRGCEKQVQYPVP